MNIFKNILTGGPKEMRQDLFNTIVFTTVYHGLKYGDISDFLRTEDAEDLIQDYSNLYSKDYLLREHWNEASTFIDYLIGDNWIYNDDKEIYIVKQILDLSEIMHPDGKPIVQFSFIGAPSHPHVETRHTQCVDDFQSYFEKIPT